MMVLIIRVITLLVVTAVILMTIILYACLLEAHTSDEEAERMHQEYLKWKEKREKHKE